MINAGKRSVLGVLVNVVDYDAACALIAEWAQRGQGAAISALAVHGVMTGVLDREHRYRLNQFDLVVPDGQPVRWALNALYRAGLKDRVYGPQLMLRVCRAAARAALPIYLYGGTREILDHMLENLRGLFPTLVIAGSEPSQFRTLTLNEAEQLVLRIRRSGAAIVFAGLGCPRQEVWAFEFARRLSMPILAVGAAFPFIAGTLREAPAWMQRVGLEWLFRMRVEPRRLWRRYALLNPQYLFLLALQACHLRRFDTAGRPPSAPILHG